MVGYFILLICASFMFQMHYIHVQNVRSYERILIQFPLPNREMGCL